MRAQSRKERRSWEWGWGWDSRRVWDTHRRYKHWTIRFVMLKKCFPSRKEVSLEFIWCVHVEVCTQVVVFMIGLIKCHWYTIGVFWLLYVPYIFLACLSPQILANLKKPHQSSLTWTCFQEPWWGTGEGASRRPGITSIPGLSILNYRTLHIVNAESSAKLV